MSGDITPKYALVTACETVHRGSLWVFLIHQYLLGISIPFIVYQISCLCMGIGIFSAVLLLPNFTLPHLKYFIYLSESYVKVVHRFGYKSFTK